MINKMQSIYELSLLLKNKHDSALLIGSYIDGFNKSNNTERIFSISSEPVKGIGKKGAYIAAMVEYLCLTFNIKIPGWVNNSQYFLKQPFFYSHFENVKATLIQESPSAFRRRNIFVSANVLSRV